jgi:hypothetical protein
VCGNGADGVPTRPPFDRIIATCGVSRIPEAWIAQTRPGGKILANVSFGLIVLTVTAEGSATGQFDTEPAGFMRLHDEPADPTPPMLEILAMTRDGGATRTTTIRPPLDYPFFHPVIDFLAALILPGILRTLLPIDPPTYVLVGPVSGSWAKAHAEGHTAVVTEHGPRVLWDELSTVITEWVNVGQPEVSDRRWRARHRAARRWYRVCSPRRGSGSAAGNGAAARWRTRRARGGCGSLQPRAASRRRH